MNFPKYWALGRSGNFLAWRWSSNSLAEAQALANQVAQQLAERFRAGGFGPKHQGLYYPDRPFREQVLQEFKDASGAVSAVVTRNSYGCLVMNTARVMFVDIDLPEPRPAVGFLQRLLFGKPAPAAAPRTQDGALANVENWTRNHPGWGWRVYRTRAGLRLMATHALVEADSSSTEQLFVALGTDPLYQKLCKNQKCFRARLTPKPWRCGVRGKPERWPWLDARAETKFQKWEKMYQSYAFNWATCEFIRHIGVEAVHPEVQPILKLHDDATRVAAKLQLA